MHDARVEPREGDELGERAGALACIERTDREPVAEHERGQRLGAARRQCEVPLEPQTAGVERAVHHVRAPIDPSCGRSGPSGTWRAMATAHTRGGERVAAVAGLGERVGSEGQEGLGRQHLVHRGGDLGIGSVEVEVVHDQAALVAEIPVVLETGRAAHGLSLPLSLPARRVHAIGGPGAGANRSNGGRGTSPPPGPFDCMTPVVIVHPEGPLPG